MNSSHNLAYKIKQSYYKKKKKKKKDELMKIIHGKNIGDNTFVTFCPILLTYNLLKFS
jgi:hypothetical protein